jgi:ammonium transporter, Amt family
VTTHAAGAAALTTWLLLDLARTRRATAVGAATGAVVGLVAITPAAGYVTPLAALAIGMLGAGASYAAILVRPRTKVDDALDVFACHGVAGITGALLTGVFASKMVNPAGADGLLAGNASQVGVQAIAVVTTIMLATIATVAILALVKVTVGLRVPLADELAGIDLSEHGEEAYHGGDVGALAGRRISIGDSVLLPSHEVKSGVGVLRTSSGGGPGR